MHWFSKHSVNHLRSCRSRFSRKILSGSIIVVFVRLEIPHLLRDNLTLPLPCCWSSSTFLYSSMWFVRRRTLLTNFLVKDFLKSCLVGRLTLKVLTTTSSRSSSISLKISQYMSEHVFRVSLSRIDIDNSEFKGRGTLLHVIKRDPNAQVSSLKESIEPAHKPLNHLIVIGSKLDGNTLHIKVSFLECTAILRLK